MRKKIFFLILAAAFLLRFWELGQIPSSIDWDEASNAYNAFSILKTAKDQYGNFLPLYNRSFDDYKPPLYMYLNVPSVAFFGLTQLAARLPSAILGFLTVPLVFILVKKISGKENLALLSMFLLSISPWHIQFSRVGFEANAGLFVAVAAVTTFLYGLTSRKTLIFSSLFVGLSVYSYHTERIFVPLIFLALFVIFKKELLAIPRKFLILFISLSILLVLPLLTLAPQKAIFQRLETTSSNANLDNVNKSIKYINQDQNSRFPLGNFFDNRRLIIAKSYLANYLVHFDPNFLFVKGDDNLRHHIKGFGMLFLFELPLLILGIINLIRQKTKATYLVLAWLLISPLAAAPASPSPHAVRSLPMIIALEITSAYGIEFLISFKSNFKNLLITFFSIWIVASFFLYLENYYRHYNEDSASFWQYGYLDAVAATEKLKDNYQKINIDHTIEQAYIFWLFGTGFDPKQYQANGTIAHFDKFYFESKPSTANNVLFVADARIFPQDFAVIKTIYYPNGTPALKIGHPR